MDILDKKEIIYTTINGNDMTEIIREMGFAPELTADSGGDPLIRFRIEGMRTHILFYGCKDGFATSLSFGACWADKRSLEKLNEWNRTKRFGKAYLDSDGDVCLQMNVDLDGGVRREYLEEILKRWRQVFLRFIEFVNE
jgi:Putative bacterial sensory transduction regulator